MLWPSLCVATPGKCWCFSGSAAAKYTVGLGGQIHALRLRVQKSNSNHIVANAVRLYTTPGLELELQNGIKSPRMKLWDLATLESPEQQQ